jgi:hypothetical protein
MARCYAGVVGDEVWVRMLDEANVSQVIDIMRRTNWPGVNMANVVAAGMGWICFDPYSIFASFVGSFVEDSPFIISSKQV